MKVDFVSSLIGILAFLLAVAIFRLSRSNMLIIDRPTILILTEVSRHNNKKFKFVGLAGVYFRDINLTCPFYGYSELVKSNIPSGHCLIFLTGNKFNFCEPSTIPSLEYMSSVISGLDVTRKRSYEVARQ